MLELRDVIHAYNGRTVLDIREFALEEGTVAALVGPNGCGKSTAMRLLALLEAPASGEVLYRGAPIANAAHRRRLRGDITFVEQSPFLFPRSVRDNLRYALKLAGVPRAAIDGRIDRSLERLGLARLGESRTPELSEGQRQSVAVARAIALEPAVLLMDEPTSAADRALAPLVHEAMTEEASRGAAILFTSHQIEDAYRWSDNVTAMADGRIVNAAPENLFRCEVPPGDTEYRTVTVGGVPLQVVTTLSGRRTIVIPAEDIVLSREPIESSARNRLRGRVIRISEHGSHGVSVVFDAGIELTVRITRNSLEEFGITLGSELSLSVKATAIQVF